MSVASEVFGLKRPELEFQPYEVIVCGTSPLVRLRDGIFDIAPPGTLHDALRADTVIVPNRPDPLAGQSDEMLAAIRSLTRKQKRMIGFCTGAFSMGDAGVLDGHTVTTHWRWAHQFAERFPAVSCQPEVLFVDDGQILTAAGSASAIDLCLYIVRKDFGASIAHSISRRLIFALHRPGGQQQFIETSTPWSPDDRIARLCLETRNHLGEAHTVSTMARSVAMAPSTFHRNFLTQIGAAPMQWLQRERIDAARRLLESTELSIDEIAVRVGLGTATNLRTHFRRQVGLSPTAYRISHHSIAG
jgi:AraC family transcriptional regulator, transcriptional activator FtrA